MNIKSINYIFLVVWIIITCIFLYTIFKFNVQINQDNSNIIINLSSYEEFKFKLYLYIIFNSLLFIMIFSTIIYKVILPHKRVLKDLKKYSENHNKLLTSKANDEISELINEFNKLVYKMNRNEQLLVQQSKMASMGEMIGAIAHQWRQPLAIVSAVLTNIEDAYEHNDLKKEYLYKQLKVGEKNIIYMSKTIDDFRNFYTPSKEKNLFKVSDTIINSLYIINSQLQENLIEVYLNSELLEIPTKKRFDELLDTVNGYENEFTQVMVNIISNAKDEFLTSTVKYPKINIDIYDENNYVVVDIQDNAKGIDNNILNKIFDPYFSTKKKLNGMGIGLYMSKMIIEKSMNGLIEASNTEDGAKFTIKLKRVIDVE